MALSEVQLPVERLERFAPLLGEARMAELTQTAERLRERLEGRTVWNVNSTATGGGVAEMLQVLIAYARGTGVDTRWLVVSGEPDFFRVTKRIHNVMHGAAGDGGPLGPEEHQVYERVLAPQAAEFADLLQPGDIVLLHDPQTAGLVDAVREAGATAIWRCHIGPQEPNDLTRTAVEFLHPYLEAAHHFIFTRQAHVHDWIPGERVSLIPPSIDPFAAKNVELDDETVKAILVEIGAVAPLPVTTSATFLRRDGAPARVSRRIELTRGGPPPAWEVPTVVQVSRWDRLKDMAGVLEGFARHVSGEAHLQLVGPSVAGVSDDPEGAEVLAECAAAWDALDPKQQSRISLICLPMNDVEENAAMVNALQRHAAVMVQKSLAEGFGLTVTEAMWKARPTVASAIGGIVDQITPGVDGVLLDDPADLEGLGSVLDRLLADRQEADRLGRAAKQTVTSRFLGDRHLLQYAQLFERLGG